MTMLYFFACLTCQLSVAFTVDLTFVGCDMMSSMVTVILAAVTGDCGVCSRYKMTLELLVKEVYILVQ